MAKASFMQADIMANMQRIMDQKSLEAERRGRKPQLPRDIHKLRMSHRINVHQSNFQNSISGQMRISTTSTHEIDASKASLKTLKRISLKDLRLEEATKGGYLTLRTLEQAFKIVGITTVVEDHQGNAVLFSIYNFTENPNPNLNEVLPPGTVFILKEPYIKISAANECMVRCDCPSDIIVVYKGHPLFGLVEGIKWRNYIDPETSIDLVFRHPKPETALGWKERGNALFKDRKFEFSTRCYLLALQELAGSGNVGNLEKVVLLNLSASYLQQGFFEKSLEFAEKVLKIDPINRKALERAGKCCYQLRKYDDACQYLTNCNALYPEVEGAKIELMKTRERLSEQAEGNFSMYKMFLSRALKPRQKIDCADYIGPIKIVEIPGKGRGIVTTKDIEPGTLLVVSKALVFDWAPQDALQFQLNHDKSADMGSNQVVITPLVQMIAKNPNTFGAIVFDLFDGSHPAKEGSASLFCDPETKQEPIVDVQRIKSILTTNSFSGSHIKPQFNQFFKISKMIEGSDGGGLFHMPSYFNHSCLPNAIWHSFNDVMFIRAIHFIKADEEVFVPYLPWEEKFTERQILCQGRGFQCDCQLCHRDRNVPKNVQSTREDIYARYEKIANGIVENARIGRDVIRRTQLLMKELQKTYKVSEEIKFNAEMLCMYTLLARAYSFDARKNCVEGIQCQHSILKLFGFDPEMMLVSLVNGDSLIVPNAFLTVQVLRAITSLVYIYDVAGQFDLRDNWIKILCTLENIHSGGDVNVVKLQYEHIKHLL